MILSASSLFGNGIPAKGQILSTSSYSALFAVIGPTYGGNGSTTFALPDMRPITPNGMTWYICDQGIFPTPR
jgi:microcystin-dependent protein